MKTNLIAIPLLVLAANSFAGMSIPKDRVYGRYNFVATGNDAEILKSVVGNRGFEGEDMGVRAIICENSRCLINADVSSLLKTEKNDGVKNRGAGDAFTNKGDRVVTNYHYVDYFANLPHITGETYYVSPSASMYYHRRDDVLDSDEELYKKLKKSKSEHVKKKVNDKGTLYSVAGENFHISCIKYNDPKEYKMGGGGHGFSLPDWMRKDIDLEYSCRTYIKAMLSELSEPVVVSTENNEVQVLQLSHDKGLIPSQGVKVRMVLEETLSKGSDNFAEITTVTNADGIAKVDKKLILTHSNEDVQGFTLHTNVYTSTYIDSLMNLKGCKKEIRKSDFLKVVGIDKTTGNILRLKRDENLCGTSYSGVNVSDNKAPSLVKRMNQAGEYVDVQCVIVGTDFPLSDYDATRKYGWNSPEAEEYEKKEHHISNAESVESAVARAQEACLESNM